MKFQKGGVFPTTLIQQRSQFIFLIIAFLDLQENLILLISYQFVIQFFAHHCTSQKICHRTRLFQDNLHKVLELPKEWQAKVTQLL